jgi:hypothetical protein
MTAYLLSGLVLRQGFALQAPWKRWLPVWLMFSGASRGVTQVRYSDRNSVPPREIDRFDVLGVDELDQPRGVWAVWSHDEAEQLGRRLCKVLGNGAELEMVTRTAKNGGWTKPRVMPDVCRESLP